MTQVKYITFGDSGAPRIKVDASLSNEEIKDLLKSEKIETAMAEKGFAYKFGLDPVYLLDEDNLNDNAFVAGAKSSIDTLKQIGQGAMATIYDAFGAESLQQQAIEAVKQYQLDQTAHQWRKDAGGEIKPRFQSLEQVFESEQEFSAFLEWAGAKLGEGLVTTIPFVLAGIVTGGVGAGAIGAGLIAKQAGTSALRQAFTQGLIGQTGKGIIGGALNRATTMSGLGFMAAGYGFGAGDTYVNQLAESDDPNVAIALAAGIPYAAAEGAFGAGNLLLDTLVRKTSPTAVKGALQKIIKDGGKYSIKKTIKGAARGDRLKALGKGIGVSSAGEATAESIQEAVTSTGQEIESGRSLSEMYSSADFWKGIGEAAAAGAVGGGPFGVVGGTAQALRVGPSVDITIDAGGERVIVPIVNSDIRNNESLYDGFVVGDAVTLTGAPVSEIIAGPTQQPSNESFDQGDPTNNPTPIYTVIGDTKIGNEEFILLEGTSGKADVFVPAGRKNSILRLDNGTINNNKFNNSAGFNYDQEESQDVNLDAKEVQESWAKNKKSWKQKGYVATDTDKAVDEYLSEEKEQWVADNVATLIDQREEQRNQETLHTIWTQNHKVRQPRFAMFYEDGDWENGAELPKEEAIGTVDGFYSKYDSIADENLKDAFENEGWQQQRYNTLQEYVENEGNQLSEDERNELNELGYNGPLGQSRIQDLVDDTTVIGNSKLTRGRRRLEQILNDKIRFETDTQGIRERKEKIITGENIIEPLTPEERQSQLGEGIFDTPVGDRVRQIRELLHLLDPKGWSWITGLERKQLAQLKREKSAYLVSGDMTKVNATQRQIDRIKRKAHVIMHNGKIVGTYSPVARRVALEEIQRLTDPEEIAIYETHVSNIDKGRVRLNELLMTFNEEPVLSTEWGTLTTRDARLKRIEKKTRNFSFSEPISYVRKYELWAKNAGEPRLQDDFADNAPKVLETMKQIISGMNLDVKIDLLPWIEQDGQALAGKFILGERGVQVAYNAVPQLRPNLNRNDSLNYVLHHEVMHLLRTEGFFTKNEYLALEEAAKDRWIKQYKIAERHPELDRATQIEEAISDAFAEYMTGRYQTGGPIAKAFNRLKQYLIALGNALTGNRFDTAANIFNAIDLGLVGARYESMQRTTDVYLTGDNATSIIVTNPYSGTELRGFVPRTRSLFTKQPTITNVKQFFKWFNSGGRPSAIVDTKGAPLIVYHITKDTRDSQPEPVNVKLWQTGLQEFSSADTSINQVRLPAAFNKLAREEVWLDFFDKGGINFDIGGGRFDNATNFLEDYNVTNIVYDPFNRSDVHNKNAVQKGANGKADTVTINNVLNVIQEEANQMQTLEQAYNALKVGGVAYISVYEGNKTGQGKQTSKGWQNNKSLNEYVPLVRKVFGKNNVIVKNGIIRVTKTDNRALRQAVPFNTFRDTADFGYHFTPDQNVIDYFKENQYSGGNDFVFKGFLNIKNPYRMPDMLSWDENDMIAYMLEDGIISERESIIMRSQIDGIPLMTDEDFAQVRGQPRQASYNIILRKLKDKGYDGVIYKNIGEDKYKALRRKADKDSTSLTDEETKLLLDNPIQDSFVAFEPQQFKSVFNDGTYGIRQPNMMAMNQWQPVPGEKPVDRYKPMNRQQRRALNAKMGKAMDEEVKLYDKDTTTLTPTKLSKFSRIAGFIREWAKDNAFFERVWRAIEDMTIKAKRIQANYQRILNNYNRIIQDDVLRELIYRAQAISTYYPDQRFTMDADGRIIFRAPMDASPENSPEGLEISPGEVIILEGDAAQAYMDYQRAMMYMAKEQIRGMIAGGYVEQIKSAINKLNFHKGVALSEAYVPNFPPDMTNEMIENMEYGEVIQLVKGLRRLLENSDAEFVDRSALTPIEIAEIQSILGVDDNMVVTDRAQVGLVKLAAQLKKFEDFKRADYVPLMRYGKFVITIIDKNQEQYLNAKATDQGAFKYKGKYVILNPKYMLRRQHYETKREADEARARFTSQYRENVGVEVRPVMELNEDKLKEQLRQGAITIVDVAQYLSDPKAEIFKAVEGELNDLIKNNKNIADFDQFFVPRQRVGGVPGYSPDFARAANQFGYMGARYASRSRFMNEAEERKKVLEEYVKESNDKQMGIALEKWWNYSNDPHQEFAQIRRLGFWWYLGGNLSSAFLQIFSAVQFTGPILSQFTSTTQAGTQLTKAFADATSMLSFTENEYGDVFIDWNKTPEDVKQAILNDMPHYIKQGQALQETGQDPGVKTLDEKTALRNFETMVIGGPFNTMEAISRLTAYMATYRLAQDPEVRDRFYKMFEGDQIVQGMINDNGGVLTPEIIARSMIDDTFGVYGKMNRPQIMRGFMAVPALFQTYIGQMFALMNRLLTKGSTPEQKAAGRKAFAKIMVMLVLTGGIFGLPGSDDAEELANWVIEKAPIVGTGLKTDMRAAMREMLYEAGFGAGLINAMENGLIEASLNIDVQRRISLGNVPGSQQIRAIAGLLGLTPGGNPADFAGAPGSVFMTAIREGSQAIREGESLVDVAFKSSPLFVRNLYKAYDQSLGKGFVETNYGSVLVDDASVFETMYQAMGFGSARAKRSREALYQERLNQTRNSNKRKKVNAQITNAYRDIFVGAKIGDSSLSAKGQIRLNELTRDLFAWNAKQDIENMIFPDLERLVESALEAVYNDIRIANQSGLNIQKNITQRKALGLE
jgi:hypothetical protein